VVGDIWTAGAAYEGYMGRWSRRVAVEFIGRLGVPDDRWWLDVGCGTGTLAATVAGQANPAGVVGVDPSEGFLAAARAQIQGHRSGFVRGDAQALPLRDGRFDAVVSGLALNFVPEPRRAAAEIARVSTAGGVAAAYVWDYRAGMAMLRYFWDAAAALDPAAAALEEGGRFALCQPEPLRELWRGAGFGEVDVEPIDVPTVFADFDDFWRPFLGGQGPAAGYAMSLPEQRRAALRDLLRSRLPTSADGSIPLTARAWAVRGIARPSGPS
jgi:SAM-dependent methyltransferase